MNDYIESFIGSINLYKGGRLRTDCPVCEHSNTFSVTDFNDCIKYNCFHADCKTSGTVSKSLSADSFKLSKKEFVSAPTDFTGTFRKNNLPYEAIQYLQQVGCHSAFVDNSADIRYDYKRDRIVFCVADKSGNVVDGAGRALQGHVKPKWYRYGAERMPFICGTSKHGVVVEDCASAVRIGHLVTGIALLGTHLFEGALSFLKDYDKITLALDHDATAKAVGMLGDIQWQVEDVDMVVLERDLKSVQNDEDVRRALNL